MARRKPKHVDTYPCPSCRSGTMRPVKAIDHQTRIGGVLFTVPEAWYEKCDQCGERGFAPQERVYWRKLFAESGTSQPDLLSPAQIRQIRESLGLGPSNFARLIGTSKQSVGRWEKENRDTPQTRAYDLLIRLAQAAAQAKDGRIDAMRLMLDNAKRQGFDIQVEIDQRAEAAG